MTRLLPYLLHFTALPADYFPDLLLLSVLQFKTYSLKLFGVFNSCLPIPDKHHNYVFAHRKSTKITCNTKCMNALFSQTSALAGEEHKTILSLMDF